jgi:hypothetical protein
MRVAAVGPVQTGSVLAQQHEAIVEHAKPSLESQLHPAAHLQGAPDRRRARDQIIELGQLGHRQPPRALMGGLVLGPE